MSPRRALFSPVISPLATRRAGRCPQGVSCISGERIRGPTITLEDGHSAVSKSEAVMWAKLHPFSPLNTGKLLNPF